VFLALTQDAHSAIFHTTGNADTHVILRGGTEPNYDAESVDAAATALAKAGLEEAIMIDFSHANSSKQHERQAVVCSDVANQISSGDSRIIGVMIESHLRAGRQDAKPGQELVYGQSITDACVDFETTEKMLEELARAVERRRAARAAA
jgi:3-deoxy-7-phosphoheptulonate synthase